MTTPTESTAQVATDRPGRYGKQLVSHLARRATGDWSDDAGRGTIDFGEDTGRAELIAGDGVLELSVSGTDLDRLEDVVGRHLVRFGSKDELIVNWRRSDGSAGSQQRNDANADAAETPPAG
jgi:hypothetical protein